MLPILIGAALGFLLGFVTVRKLLEWIPFVVIYLFAGLMVGAFPAVKDELKGVTLTPKRIALMVAGACIPVAVAVYSSIVSLQGGVEGGILGASLAWKIVLPLLVGYVMAITQIVPGLSASAILMAIGWYSMLMNGIETIFTDGDMLLVVASLVVGFVVGFFTFSKVLSSLLKGARESTYSMIVGMALGSVLTMFLNGDAVEIYAQWGAYGVDWAQLIAGIVLMVAGVQKVIMVLKVSAGQNTQFSSFAMTCPEESGRILVLCNTNPNAMQKKRRSMGFSVAVMVASMASSFVEIERIIAHYAKFVNGARKQIRAIFCV